MGNGDRNSVVKHVVYGLLTRYVRFLPQTYQGLVCLRTEVFGVKQKPGICAGMIILHNQRRFNIYIYHIVGSACGQYKANPVFWLAIWAHLACSRLPSLILCKKKWTYKVSNFCIMSVIKLQKEAEHSQNRKNISNIFGFIMLQTQLASFPGSQN